MRRKKRIISPFSLLVLLAALSYALLWVYGYGFLVYADHHQEGLETRDRCFYLSGFSTDIFSPKETRSYLLLSCPLTHKFEDDMDACSDRPAEGSAGALAYQGNDYDCAQ